MAKKQSNPETQLVTLEQVDVNKLPELIDWRKKLIEIDKANPVIKEIKNHKTYEKAKKHRHNRRQGRYEVQKSESNITSRLNEIKKDSKNLHTDLIDIVKPGEDEQDQFIKDYEQKKENERIEKERIETERKDKIKAEINSFYTHWKEVISEMKFYEIDDFKKEIVVQLEEKDEKDFEEFQEDFNEKVTLLRDQFKERSEYLKQQEEDRIAREKLKKEKAELARKQKEKSDRDQKRNTEMQPYIVFIRNYPAMLEMDEETYQKEFADIKKGAEFQWKCEREEREKEEEEKQKRLQKRFDIRCNRLEEIGFTVNDETDFVNKEYDINLGEIFDDVYGLEDEDFEDMIQQAKTSLVNAKAEAESKPADEQSVDEWDKAKIHDKPAQIKIDAEWDDSEKTKEQEVVEPETVESEEEDVEVWDLPEETPMQISKKINGIAWEMRNDYTSPKHQIKKIISLSEKLIELL